MVTDHFDCNWLCVSVICLVRLWLDNNGDADDDADDDGIREYPCIYVGDSYRIHFVGGSDFCLLDHATKQKGPSSL